MDLGHLIQGRAMVWCHGPIYLGPHSEPVPDFTLLRPRPDRYRNGLPRAEDVLLVMEIADTSLRYDRDIKGSLYRTRRVAGILDRQPAQLHDRNAPRSGQNLWPLAHRQGSQRRNAIAVGSARPGHRHHGLAELADAWLATVMQVCSFRRLKRLTRNRSSNLGR
jgi:hypothetical protein